MLSSTSISSSHDRSHDKSDTSHNICGESSHSDGDDHHYDVKDGQENVRKCTRADVFCIVCCVALLFSIAWIISVAATTFNDKPHLYQQLRKHIFECNCVPGNTGNVQYCDLSSDPDRFQRLCYLNDTKCCKSWRGVDDTRECAVYGEGSAICRQEKYLKSKPGFAILTTITGVVSAVFVGVLFIILRSPECGIFLRCTIPATGTVREDDE